MRGRARPSLVPSVRVVRVRRNVAERVSALVEAGVIDIEDTATTAARQQNPVRTVTNVRNDTVALAQVAADLRLGKPLDKSERQKGAVKAKKRTA